MRLARAASSSALWCHLLRRTSRASISDPTRGIFLGKLGKNYQAGRPVDLLAYTDGSLVSPDDQIIAELEHLIQMHGRGPFRRIWLLGEKICREI
jgi:hypothetical protein